MFKLFKKWKLTLKTRKAFQQLLKKKDIRMGIKVLIFFYAMWYILVRQIVIFSALLLGL